MQPAGGRYIHSFKWFALRFRNIPVTWHLYFSMDYTSEKSSWEIWCYSVYFNWRVQNPRLTWPLCRSLFHLYSELVYVCLIYCQRDHKLQCNTWHLQWLSYWKYINLQKLPLIPTKELAAVALPFCTTCIELNTPI